MKRLIAWTWLDGIVSTFLSGLFAILPIVITVAIIGWVVAYLQTLLGPASQLGGALESVGLQFATDKITALVIGWVFVLSGIWLLGLLTKSMARNRILGALDRAIHHIPVVKGIYSTTSQLVGMLRKDERSELKGMSVVFCAFGDQPGGGFLGLMATPDVYRFDNQDYHLVYAPMAPLPMWGGIVFISADKVVKLDMSPEQAMRICLSLGILASQVIPKAHQVPADFTNLQPQGQTVQS